MKAEIASIKLKIGNEEKTITVEQARALQAALNELLGTSSSDLADAVRKLAEKTSPAPIILPQPYPVPYPVYSEPVYPRPSNIWSTTGLPCHIPQITC